jgi:hypothetical protein
MAIKYKPKPALPPMSSEEKRDAYAALDARRISADLARCNGDDKTADWLDRRCAEIASDMELRNAPSKTAEYRKAN